MMYRQLKINQQFNNRDQSKFGYPLALVNDDKNNHLIVSDCNNSCLYWLNGLTLKYLTSVQNITRHPYGLCLQPITNNLVVCDAGHHRVQVLSLDHKYVVPPTIFALGANAHRTLSIKKGEFSFPQGVCCRPNGDIFVGDTHNSRVQIFDCSGRFLSTFGCDGCENQEFRGPRDLCLVHASFSPSSLASEILCVNDFRNERVSVWTTKSHLQHLFNFQVPGHAVGLCVDLNGYLHVSCSYPSYAISIYDLRMIRSTNSTNSTNEPLLIQTLGKRKNVSFPKPGEFIEPSGMCVDKTNTLLVADYYSMQILFFDQNNDNVDENALFL